MRNPDKLNEKPDVSFHNKFKMYMCMVAELPFVVEQFWVPVELDSPSLVAAARTTRSIADSVDSRRADAWHREREATASSTAGCGPTALERCGSAAACGRS